MRKTILIIATLLICFVSSGQEQNVKKTNFKFTKSLITEADKVSLQDIKGMKAKDFAEDQRTAIISPTDRTIEFDLGFVVKTIQITDESFSLIDKVWQFRLKDEDFAYFTIGEDYAIIYLEGDNRKLILVTEQFKFGK